MNEASLSTLIALLHQSWSTECYESLISAFRKSAVGIIALNVPREAVGRSIETTSEEITLGSTQHGDGQSRILAFAEPRDFVAKFGPKCNGEMLGEELVKVMLHNPNCTGILLNSSLAEISVAMERADLVAAKVETVTKAETTSTIPKSPWWKLWQ